MGAMASQITSLTIVYWTVYSGADKKTSKLRVTDLCAGNSPVIFEFPAQIARVYTWGEGRHIPIVWQTDCQCPKSIILNIYYVMVISVIRSTVFHNTLLIYVASSFAPLLICACLSRDRYEFPVLSCTPGWPKYRTLTLWYNFHASRQAGEQAAYIVRRPYTQYKATRW